MSRRSKLGRFAAVAAMLAFAFAPQAHARDSAKFKVLSISGTTTAARDVVYEPSDFGSCSFSQTERISFHSTKPITAYVFTSKAHGHRRVEWWSKPTFPGNLTRVAIPGEVTVARSATYHQTNYVDPDTGETTPGCYHEFSPVDCAVERTMAVTLYIGGSSDSAETTYVVVDLSPRQLSDLDDQCPVEMFPGLGEAPGLFARSKLFKNRPKRISDSDRVETPAFDNDSDDATVTGTTVDQVAGELKRKPLRRNPPN